MHAARGSLANDQCAFKTNPVRQTVAFKTRSTVVALVGIGSPSTRAGSYYASLVYKSKGFIWSHAKNIVTKERHVYGRENDRSAS